MKILISGASGLIGSEIKQRLQARGDEVVALSRVAREGTIAWPEGGILNPSDLEGFDAVIHLAGENVGGRWTKAKKQAIYDSRVHRTRDLCQALAQTINPPQAFLCASAIGIYGDRGGEELSEESAPGTGFLADVCRDWEAACTPLANKTRLVHLRFSVVFDKSGGVLKKMLLPFQFGLGGPLGDGLQYVSWISLEDAARAVIYLLDNNHS
ncbi:MAG TPA: TIGR01777 family oxidoreductase, partial [Abditibacteriaceae bacterium]